ncbi:MAG: response regulator transcription factor [Planctomycetales bacterium]|nr:response regulator transcription factor [Planctomycetales bacterium]
MSKTRILVVEDDAPLADVIAYNLKGSGYEVDVAGDGRQALRLAEENTPDLVVLDLMLPIVDGLDVCRRLRAGTATAETLIVMLTAKSEEADQIVGFTLGADDYVTKPFSVKVLLQRISALLRRRHTLRDQNDVVRHQGVTIDRQRHRASVGEDKLQLTRSEFRLLDAMIRRPGRVFSRQELISAVDNDSLVMERTIDVHIRSLRVKLGDAAELIETVRGVGYRVRESDAA